ncbi:hypothetical protein RFI_12855 [Reticulomyxa filosa]|uniref:Uncharacterized protein n=1 Tax=Reticulomyxa filosa TaxID=46433 RepID=X6NG39_RETFI|nr:hypothetical protein RFI_12855 [Reticulomyxa filosa]|eukprot:ETO24302.1 hypothetical protein RFI_12855 [Reticulomyxa filosa]
MAGLMRRISVKLCTLANANSIRSSLMTDRMFRPLFVSQWREFARKVRDDDDFLSELEEDDIDIDETKKKPAPRDKKGSRQASSNSRADDDVYLGDEDVDIDSDPEISRGRRTQRGREQVSQSRGRRDSDFDDRDATTESSRQRTYSRQDSNERQHTGRRGEYTNDNNNNNRNNRNFRPDRDSADFIKQEARPSGATPYPPRPGANTNEDRFGAESSQTNFESGDRSRTFTGDNVVDSNTHRPRGVAVVDSFTIQCKGSLDTSKINDILKSHLSANKLQGTATVVRIQRQENALGKEVSVIVKCSIPQTASQLVQRFKNTKPFGPNTEITFTTSRRDTQGTP